MKTIFDLIHPIIGLIPGSISTDCDSALRNAISTVFPESPTLLCLWHANKNIQQHCKRKFTSAEAYNEFFQAWLGIVRSPDVPEYWKRLRQFKSKYSDTLERKECATYVCNTWLKQGRREDLVQAWTNKYPHFGTTVTSR
jgi:MULE transposase domain